MWPRWRDEGPWTRILGCVGSTGAWVAWKMGTRRGLTLACEGRTLHCYTWVTHTRQEDMFPSPLASSMRRYPL
jgi:hypothetical protein